VSGGHSHLIMTQRAGLVLRDILPPSRACACEGRRAERQAIYTGSGAVGQREAPRAGQTFSGKRQPAGRAAQRDATDVKGFTPVAALALVKAATKAPSKLPGKEVASPESDAYNAKMRDRREY